MLSYLARRLLLAVPTMLGAVTLIFLLLRLLPGDPALILAGPQASGQDVAHLRQLFGTDQPVALQYLHYVLGLLHGDFGVSMQTRGPVLTEILSRLPYTVELALIAMLIATAAGMLLGVLAALNSHSWLDVLISSGAVLGVSLPAFWLGLMLIILFSIDVRVFPAGGIEGNFTWVLPSLTLSAVTMGIIARMTRSSLLETLGQDYIRTARAKGARPAVVVTKHALRNALLPVLTVTGLQFGQLLGGAVLTETVFAWPGIGRLLVDAILARDYPVVQGVIVLFAAAYIIVNILVDILYSYVDPRIRFD
jgi:peptide/nickel transport system permease protein/oligopeptide transport system permease protein